MNIVFLDTVTMGGDISSRKIKSMYEDFGMVTLYENTAQDKVSDRIVDADIVVMNKCALRAEALKSAKNLKLICVCATGYDNVDLDYCRNNGIAVCNVRNYSTDSVAQVTVAMALSLVCGLRSYTRYVNSGSYAASGSPNYLLPVYHEISSMKWGIVGMGSIGRKTAEIAKALGAEVVTYTRSDSYGYKSIDIDSLCRECDIISLHVPLSAETRNLINADRLKLMKDSAILINVARGAVVDEEAVADAVISGSIGGIGIDVYSNEPIERNSPYHRLYGMDNVIFTPHMSWGAYEARIRCLEIVRNNIRSFIDGENENRIV